MSVTAIIPTLNEEECLARTLSALRGQRPGEILVVDGGSKDGTHKAAAAADRFLSGPRGRARQLNLGAAQASGDLLLFLHADCILENGALAEAERRLRRSGVAAVCFRQRVQAEGTMFRVIDACATARVQRTGLGYGDQGLLLRRATFEQVGGYPDVPFLEDVLMSRNLRSQGKLVVTRRHIFVSPRRWQRVGLVQQTLRNWSLTALAAFGVPVSRLAAYYPAVR